ncbi:hypothetical protein PAXRUDRAFT_173407 [Paxillus rubicundulus Ve08.2h10]|uniref:C2H2-type domain-containing protein n=1 Tax=Paxillus rubicundulus Ve08.2h10 TaxID=930991 RepID=A0A0D0DD00_9AGAM|nr:hypothetical protein PAXRUDRAFT_173407 [Paxillus rubicundulus Ve08.2h10]
MSLYNENFGEDDSCDLVGYGFDIKYYVCHWRTDNGMRCNTQIQGREYATHIRTVHGVGRDKRLECRWDNCGESLKKDCVVRHLQERHLLYRWPCPRCLLSFTRRSNMNTHRADCNGTG